MRWKLRTRRMSTLFTTGTLVSCLGLNRLRRGWFSAPAIPLVAFVLGAAVLGTASVPVPPGASHAITVRLLPEATTARLRDSLRFELRFLNASRDSVRLWAPIAPGSAGDPLVLMHIRGPGGVQTVLQPAVLRQSVYAGSYADYVILKPGDSTTIRIGIGGDWGSLGPRGLNFWNKRVGPRGALGPYWKSVDWVEEVFDVPGEYAVSVEYDLRHAAEPWPPPLGPKPDSTSRVPLIRELLRAGPVRVTISSRAD